MVPTRLIRPALLVLLATLLACADDIPINAVTPDEDAGTRDVVAADAGRDTAEDTDADAPMSADVAQDAPAAHDADSDALDTGFDTPDIPDATPPPARPDDWACDRGLRVAACERLSDTVAAPDDPADLLFYVNRVRAIPADYPIPAGSTWTPCDGSDVTPSVAMTCLPSAYQTASNRGLRTVAWDSDVGDIVTTHDGLPVGHRGRVGFKALIDAARAEAGHELLVASAFRSWGTQQSLHEGYVDREMSGGLSEDEARIVAATYSARPGHSEHQLGTTADLTYRQDDGSVFPGLDQVMGASRAFIWTTANAHRFGIVLTYDPRRVAETQYVYEPWHFRFVGVDAADAMRACDLTTEEFLAARYGEDAAPPWEGEPWILWNDAQLAGHPTLPPGATIAPGDSAVKTWRVVNAGTENWTDVTLARLSGADTGDDAVPVACTAVGGTRDVEVAIIAPSTEGPLEATWQLVAADGTPFGPELPLRITVGTTPTGTDAGWVRVRDTSGVVTGADPGADIDAVVVLRVDGTEVYASEVAAWTATPADVVHGDPTDVLGAPDAFGAWPSTETCSVEFGFVSLGGAGELVVRVPVPLQAGDQVVVLEVGGCAWSGGEAILDPVEVSIGATADGPWIRLVEDTGPAIRAIVP